MEQPSEQQQKLRYRIQINVNGTLLNYNVCKIISDNDGWIEFEDRYNARYKYNKALVISMQEVEPLK